MMDSVRSIWILSLIIPVFATQCKRDPLDVDVSGIQVDFRIERFDKELFLMNLDTLEEAIPYFYKKYGSFFDIYNVHILNIGPASNRLYPSYLSMFINDPTNREVFKYTERKMGDMNHSREVILNGLRHYKYYFPDSIPPRVIGYVSRFNQGLFTVDHIIGLGLDQYLGSDCAYYEYLGIPHYLVKNKIPAKIPSDVIYAWATQLFPYNDSVDNVLTRMVYQGLLMYFVDAMYPEMEDSLKIGFTADELNWCIRNEKQMWTYLVEHKLLFSTDALVIRKLIEEAPHTSFYTEESPGRAAVWQGWQIVRAYMEKQPGISLTKLMQIRDYQEILRQSRYHP